MICRETAIRSSRIPGRFCFGMDAVLLSGFARAREGARVIDLGTGTGIIPILMEAKTKAAHLTGLETRKKVQIWQDVVYSSTVLPIRLQS